MKDRNADLAAVTDLVADLAAALQARGARLACAESCTGGLLAAACTEQAGSSEWFDRGVVSYSNPAKTALLGVPSPLIEQHGAVSQPVACAMAEGLQRSSGADLTVAITGIAGPGGGSAAKPVGTVWFGYAWRDGRELRVDSECCRFDGDRAQVRRAAVAQALRGLLQRLPEPARSPSAPRASCDLAADAKPAPSSPPSHRNGSAKP